MTSTPLLELEKLNKSFLTHHLNQRYVGVEDISISVYLQDFLGIVGPSGSGKSNIIKCIYRAYLPTSGHIWYDSKAFGRIDLAQASERLVMALRKNEIGYVSQFLDIMPRVTTFDLVRQQLLELGQDKAVADDQAAEMLRHFMIDEALWKQYPRTFSGGEKLRLNLARTYVKAPHLLLLDEPTASLDQSSKEKVREAILKLKESGTTTIGIFHDLEFMEGLITDTFNISEAKQLLQ